MERLVGNYGMTLSTGDQSAPYLRQGSQIPRKRLHQASRRVVVQDVLDVLLPADDVHHLGSVENEQAQCELQMVRDSCTIFTDAEHGAELRGDAFPHTINCFRLGIATWPDRNQGKEIHEGRDVLMIYFYMDESGTGLNDERSAFFVLTAFSVTTDHWQVIDSALVTLKRRLVSWAKPEDWEIKGRDMRRGDKFFKDQPWEKRVQAIVEVADLVAHTPCRILTVQVDKRDLPDYISSDSDLYRIAFWRLLEMIEAELDEQGSAGMLMVDARSDMHSSVQDRRLLDAYREWTASRHGRTHLIELPWFGFSAFYAGLQLADFAAYVIDFVTNEHDRPKRSSELEEAYRRFQGKVKLAHIP